MKSLPKETAVAVLDGKNVVTEDDVAGWQAAQACYGEGAIASRKAAFMRLIEAAIAEQPLKAAGAAKFSRAEFDAEAARIDRETQAPDILSCIKKNLGPGKARYLRVFVRPTFIESRLREYLLHDASAQSGPRNLVSDAIAAALGGESMEAAAEEGGLIYSTMTYAVEASSGEAHVPGKMPWSPFEKSFIEQHLKTLKPGELKKEPIESDYDFRMVRLLGTDGNHWTFETAYRSKLGQEEWFKAAPKMKLAINDADLRQWVKNIRGNPRLGATEIK